VLDGTNKMLFKIHVCATRRNTARLRISRKLYLLPQGPPPPDSHTPLQDCIITDLGADSEIPMRYSRVARACLMPILKADDGTGSPKISSTIL
jgi:hypothetical protein